MVFSLLLKQFSQDVPLFVTVESFLNQSFVFIRYLILVTSAWTEGLGDVRIDCISLIVICHLLCESDVLAHVGVY